MIWLNKKRFREKSHNVTGKIPLLLQILLGPLNCIIVHNNKLEKDREIVHKLSIPETPFGTSECVILNIRNIIEFFFVYRQEKDEFENFIHVALMQENSEEFTFKFQPFVFLIGCSLPPY